MPTRTHARTCMHACHQHHHTHEPRPELSTQSRCPPHPLLPLALQEFRELLLGTTLPDTLHQYDPRLKQLALVRQPDPLQSVVLSSTDQL